MVYHDDPPVSTKRGEGGGYDRAVTGTPKPSRPRSSKPPKGDRPPPSGHTETLRIALREARDRLGLTQRDIAERLARDFGIEVTDSAVGNWERMEREPTIAEFAAWARVVGLRLVVEVEPAQSPRRAVMVAPELAEVAATASRLALAKAEDALVILERLHGMTPSEVARLARYLSDTTDED